MTKLTTKQATAITKMVENGGNISRAMVDAGYSENTAHTPSKLTNSPAVQEAIRITNEQLAIKYELTIDEAYRLIADAKTAEKVNMVTGEITPDHTTRLKVATMIMKLHELEELSLLKGNPQTKTILKIDANMDDVELLKSLNSL